MKSLLEQIEDYQDAVKDLLMGNKSNTDPSKPNSKNPTTAKTDDEDGSEITIRAGEKSIKFDDSDWSVLTDKDLESQGEIPLLRKDIVVINNQPQSKRMGDEDSGEHSVKKSSKSKDLGGPSVRTPSDSEVEKLASKLRRESVDLNTFLPVGEKKFNIPTTPQQRLDESEKRKKQLGDLWDSIL